jgi:hypothetical protein
MINLQEQEGISIKTPLPQPIDEAYIGIGRELVGHEYLGTIKNVVVEIDKDGNNSIAEAVSFANTAIKAVSASESKKELRTTPIAIVATESTLGGAPKVLTPELDNMIIAALTNDLNRRQRQALLNVAVYFTNSTATAAADVAAAIINHGAGKRIAANDENSPLTLWIPFSLGMLLKSTLIDGTSINYLDHIRQVLNAIIILDMAGINEVVMALDDYIFRTPTSLPRVEKDENVGLHANRYYYFSVGAFDVRGNDTGTYLSVLEFTAYTSPFAASINGLNIEKKLEVEFKMAVTALDSAEKELAATKDSLTKALPAEKETLEAKVKEAEEAIKKAKTNKESAEKALEKARKGKK